MDSRAAIGEKNEKTKIGGWRRKRNGTKEGGAVASDGVTITKMCL